MVASWMFAGVAYQSTGRVWTVPEKRPLSRCCGHWFKRLVFHRCAKFYTPMKDAQVSEQNFSFDQILPVKAKNAARLFKATSIRPLPTTAQWRWGGGICC
jgi:hypothetical protein